MAPPLPSLLKSPDGLPTSRVVTVLDLVVLLGNVYRGLENTHVGFEDANKTLYEVVGKLNERFRVPLFAIESALWSCNLLHEQNKFWHPKGLSFHGYLKQFLGKDRFDFRYNFIQHDRDVDQP